MKRKLILIVLITMIPLFTPALVQAQNEDETEQSGPGDPQNPDAPIDGGLSILLAAGVGYGVKKIRDNRKKNAELKEDAIEK